MNITIPIECSEGHQYLLKLTDCKNLPIESTIDIVDIALISVTNVDIINNAGTLNKIAVILSNFLDDNDVVLYFYCSKDPIKLRKNRKEVSYQEYRSSLFSSMFNRTAKRSKMTYINKLVVLKDNIYGDHYIHLIAKTNFSNMIDELESHLNSLMK